MSGIEVKSWEDERFRVNRDVLVSVDPKTGIVTPFPMTADQEIRARALECAVRLYSNEESSDLDDAAFWGCVRMFEAYIKVGR